MDFINQAFGYVMQFCYRITNNYALALLLFALFAQLIQLPVGIKQQKNYQKQTLLKPKELAIRKKYKGKNDTETKQKMQLEVNEMYQKNGYNQFAGCLPSVIILVLIIPLYAIIRMPLTYISGIKAEQINRLYAIVAYQKETNTDKLADVDFAKVSPLLGKDGKPVTGADITPESEASSAISAVSTAEVSVVNTSGTTSEVKKTTFTDYFNDISKKGEIELAAILNNGTNTFSNTQLEAVEIDMTQFNRDQLDFDLLGISLLLTPGFTADSWILMFIPILVFITSVVAQMIMTKWQTPTQIGPNGDEMKMPGGVMMKWGLPLMSAIFSMQFQAAIGLYWIYGNILRVGQSYLMSKFFPLKRWTPEELASVEKEYNINKKKKKVIMIEVDEDDNSYSNLEITPDQAEKKVKKQQLSIEAEALAKAAALDAELDAKAAELAEKKKSNPPKMKEDISHDNSKDDKKKK